MESYNYPISFKNTDPYFNKANLFFTKPHLLLVTTASIAVELEILTSSLIVRTSLKITTLHAKQLWSAGVDFVAVDSTNIPDTSAEGMVLQIRPTLVLYEEWLILRRQGVMTPQIAVWPKIVPGSNEWQYYLDTVYNNATYDSMDLVMRDPKTNKKVMFLVPGGADPNIVRAIESNGGRNNIVTVWMWALQSQAELAQGYWSFFAPCITDGSYTSSVVGVPCKQGITTNSPLGTQMAASPSYQLSYGSLPGVAPGKLRGLTFKSLWQNIIATQPNYVFMSSWNEWLSQPQPNPYAGRINNAFSMGLPNDPQRTSLFVDTYGAEWSRDIEPSVTYGSYYYDLMSSCIRVYRNAAPGTCPQNEECCNSGNSSVWTNVYSLYNPNNNDYLLSVVVQEVNYLLSLGWQEICNPFSGPTPAVSCVNGQLTTGTGAFFIVYTGTAQGNKQVFYRCQTAAAMHFFSLDERCEGMGTLNGPLGFVALSRSSEMPRGLYRCQSGQSFAHSLDLPCPAGQTQAFMGYVR